MPKYSIIVPVYNVEKYLKECLDSILAQDTKSAYEVILVDDGSTDSSGEICDQYGNNYPAFRVIHQANQKLSCARNAGLAIASGDFVIFFDSDDIWKPSLLSSMEAATEEDPDITLFLFESFGEGVVPTVFRPALLPNGESGPEYLQRLFDLQELPMPSAWTYMYRRKFLVENQLIFEPGLESTEDFDFNFAAFSTAKKVTAVDRALYLYRIRAGSLSLTPSLVKQIARLKIVSKWYRRYPVPPIADHFAKDCLSISMVGSKKAASELIAIAEENRDIFQNVGDRKMKLARFLYRTFGFYTGSAIYLDLVKFKHLLQGKGKTKL